MPTYEYKCLSCGYIFDLFQSMSAVPITECPSCSNNSLKRMIGSGGGIIFKGSGFYQTDYRSPSYQNGAKTDSKKTKVKDNKTSSSEKKESSPSTSSTKV